MEEKHKAQLELMELQTERRLNEWKRARASRGRAAARLLRSPRVRARGRRKAPGEGRGPGRVKIREEATFCELKDEHYERSEFLMHWEISSRRCTRARQLDIRRLKAYWDEDKQCTKRQAKQRAECFSTSSAWRPASGVGDADAMLDYLLGGRDLGDEPNELGNRRHQIATWLWPNHVSTTPRSPTGRRQVH